MALLSPFTTPCISYVRKSILTAVNSNPSSAADSSCLLYHHVHLHHSPSSSAAATATKPNNLVFVKMPPANSQNNSERDYWFFIEFSPDEVTALRKGFAVIKEQSETLITSTFARLLDLHAEAYSAVVKKRRSEAVTSPDDVAYCWETQLVGAKVLHVVERCLNRTDQKHAFAGVVQELAAEFVARKVTSNQAMDLLGIMRRELLAKLEQEKQLTMPMTVTWSKFFNILALSLVVEMGKKVSTPTMVQ